MGPVSRTHGWSSRTPPVRPPPRSRSRCRAIAVSEAEYADLSFYCHRIVFPQNAAREQDPEAGLALRLFIESYYDKRTYDVIIRHADVYAQSHRDDDPPSPVAIYPELFTTKSLVEKLRRRRDRLRSRSPRE